MEASVTSPEDHTGQPACADDHELPAAHIAKSPEEPVSDFALVDPPGIQRAILDDELDIDNWG
jgi:hypothetical protein